jgi:predicted PurR-regulated permease PerM
VQEAAAQLAQVSTGTPSPPATTSRGVTRVQIERPRFDVKDYLWTGTLGLVTLMGQTAMVVFITYFVLAAGDSFRRKLARIAGPTFSKRKITVQALKEITQQIRRYLLVQVLTSVLVGVATGFAFAWIGLQHSVAWGVAAGVLNLIPYLGALVLTAAAAMTGLMQFDSLDQAALVGGTSFAIHIVSGYMVTPWLTSRASRMSPVVVFVSVLAWGWLWGMWGLLLGIPILMVVKAVCDRVEDLKPIGELLGD